MTGVVKATGSIPASWPPEQAPSRSHIPALDGVRGLAILLVMVHNLSILQPAPGLTYKLWSTAVDAGWIGVQLFFVLSGFLITGILLDDRKRPHALRVFYIRRSLRIWPLYYAFLIAYAAIVLWRLDTPPGYFLWYIFYLSNWTDPLYHPLPGVGHFWSLAVEEQFYLTWPWLAMRMRPAWLAWFCIAITVMAFVARLVMHGAKVEALWIYESTPTRADALALGALVAIALRSPEWRLRMQRWAVPVAMVALFGLLAIAARTHGLERDNGIVEVYGYGLLSVFFAAWIARIVTGLANDSIARRVLCNRWLRAAGRYSYAAYVLHFPIKVFLFDAINPGRLGAAYPVSMDVTYITLIGALSFGAAVITGMVIERPFLRLKDRWAAR